MSDRATFGDLAGAATMYLARAVSLTGLGNAGSTTASRRLHAGYVRRGLRNLAVIMNRYLDDISGVTYRHPEGWHRFPESWARAGTEAQQQLKITAAFLALDWEAPGAAGRAASPLDHSLRSAVAALTAGRDFLATHLLTAPNDATISRSEWAPVVTSAPIGAALMAELGRYARLAAVCGTKLDEAASPASRLAPGTPAKPTRASGPLSDLAGTAPAPDQPAGIDRSDQLARPPLRERQQLRQRHTRRSLTGRHRPDVPAAGARNRPAERSSPTRRDDSGTRLQPGQRPSARLKVQGR